MNLNVGAATDVGQLRSLNEDNYSVGDDVVAVADGMGGHNGGEVASALALA
ncbi:MAG: serine/threonine-protein phosphatase, partial [Actinobacteria bacterium]|nr:serine/threonine-protein phosphatase [Actinomycetota bacterium]